jgi:holin-like protein
MLPYVTLLLVCQLVGEVISRLLALPVPGPVIGMVILFAGLSLRGRPAAGLEGAANGLLRHLSLLFVPAGVGVAQYFSLLSDQWLPVGVALVGSTVATLVATAAAMGLLTRARPGGGERL